MSDETETEQEAAAIAPVDRVSFDATDRPPAGTECARCRKLFAHWCPAKGYAGETPLCVACGAGGRCEQVEAVLRMERNVGYEDLEVETRGLHGECRKVPVEDAERTAASARDEPSSAWTVKASLSAANLSAANLAGRKRARTGMVQAQRVRGKRPEEERDAERRRRMTEARGTNDRATVVPVAAAGLCSRGCGRPIHRGSCAKTAAWRRGCERGCDAPAKQMAARKQAALAKLEAALPPLPGVLEVPGGELISVKVSEAALNRLFAMLPPAMKGAAIEKLLAEMTA